MSDNRGFHVCVKDYMTRQVITVSTESSVAEAIGLLRKYKVKGIPVLNSDGKVCGMFTLKNLLYIIEDQVPLDLPVKAIMHPNVTVIDEETPIDETCLYPQKRLPVIDKSGKMVGILTKSDIIRGFKSKSVSVRQQLQAVLESTPHGIITVNQENRITFINHAAEQMFRFYSQQVVGKAFDEIFPECKLIRDQVLQKGQIIRNCKNTNYGCAYVADAAPVMDGQKISGAVISLQSISDIEQMADELNLVKQLYQELNAIIDYSYDGIFVTDAEGVILKINAATGKLLGIIPEEVLHCNASEVVRKNRLGACVTDKVLEGKKTYSVSYKLNGKTIALTGNPVFDERGNLIRIIANVRDFTELSYLRQELEHVNRLKEMYYSELSRLKVEVDSAIGTFRSEEMKRIYDLALRIAVVDTPVLIYGESGVGKEVLANFIHSNSMRRDKPFIKINCAAIPESLLESELFGYAEGAFTGAKKGGKPGVFEIASGGTLFLDEVGEMPLNIQVKLLRALQDQEIFKVGASKPVKYDVRLLFATNRNLEKEIGAGRFREDLYYRINVVPVTIPALRERPEDIAILAATYLAKFNKKYNLDKKLSAEALEVFTAYSWPGNIRELINVLERLIITSQQEVVLLEDLPRNMFQQVAQKLSTQVGPLLPLKNVIDMVERDVIERALRECKSLRQAARTLGVDPSTLLRKADKHKIRTNTELLEC